MIRGFYNSYGYIIFDNRILLMKRGVCKEFAENPTLYGHNMEEDCYKDCEKLAGEGKHFEVFFQEGLTLDPNLEMN